MRSARPKPIHLLCGRAMTSYVLDSLASAGVGRAVIVTGRNGGLVSKRLLEDPPAFPVAFAEQDLDLGAADAALVGLTHFENFDDEGDLVIVPADIPLLRPSAIRRMIDAHQAKGAACTVLTAAADHPDLLSGNEPVALDRVERDRRGRVAAIEPSAVIPGRNGGYGAYGINPDGAYPEVPDTNGSGDEAAANEGSSSGVGSAVGEVGLGIYCIRRGLLAPVLRRCLSESLSARVPLREMIAVLAETGHACETISIGQPRDARAVDNRVELSQAEAELRRRTNRYWMSMGVTMVDPDHAYIDATVELGTDVTVFPDTILQGATTIGDGCELGPGTHLDRCKVGNNCRIEQTTASLAIIGDDCTVGPFAVLEPGTELADGTKTGPFYAGA